MKLWISQREKTIGYSNKHDLPRSRSGLVAIGHVVFLTKTAFCSGWAVAAYFVMYNVDPDDHYSQRPIRIYCTLELFMRYLIDSWHLLRSLLGGATRVESQGMVIWPSRIYSTSKLMHLWRVDQVCAPIPGQYALQIRDVLVTTGHCIQ